MQTVQTLHPADFFVMRTPLLPFDTFVAWGDLAQAPATTADDATFAQTIAADRQALRAQLRQALTQPALRDAIYLASPDLDGSFDHWLQAPDSERGQRVEHALVRYFARMAGRATPFGLFSGCSVGAIGAGATQLTLSDQSAYQRHTRLDMDYLFTLTEALNRDLAIQTTLCYRPNPTLYATAGRLRYAEARLHGKVRAYHLVAVEPTPYLEATLQRAVQGAPRTALATALVSDDPEITPEEASAYVDELIASQLLVPNLAPAVTGTEPIHGLIDQLGRHPVTYAIAQQLAGVRTALAEIDQTGLGVAAAHYQALAQELTALPAKVDLGRLFQVDLVKPAPTARLGPPVIQAIRQGLDILAQLTTQRDESLAQFAEAFTKRYETRSVPLLEVLDEESGLGFGNTGSETAPLLAGLAFPTTGGTSTPAWGNLQRLLLNKIAEAQQKQSRQIELTAQDLTALALPSSPPLPDALAVMATLVAPSSAAVAAGQFQVVLEGAAGPSGARLLGRFCHADPTLHHKVVQYLQAEEALDPEAIYAEIVHLPEGRVGNVICRPVLRGYEIPFLGQSGAAPSVQLLLSELTVAVVNGEVILYSQRLQRRVIPRLSTAHNFAWRSLPVYKFLCALQHQGVVAGLGWEWGALESMAFLPRVTSGRVVLARARWRVTQTEIRAFSKAQGAALYQAVQHWRVERGLPRLLLLADGDNQLPVDLHNMLSIESFIDVVKGRSVFTLIELLPGPAELCADGPEGRFVHELVIPWLRQAQTQTATDSTEHPLSTPKPRQMPSPATTIPRRFAPGSEWLYLKLYTGAATADQVLRDVIGPVAQASSEAGLIDQWFFVRYADPDWHLRIRFHSPAGASQRLYSELLPLLQAQFAPLLHDGRLWRVQLDTYEREVERYGGDTGVCIAEELSHIDSRAAVALLTQLAGDAGEEVRWRLSLRGLDLTLNMLGFALQEKQRLMRQLRDQFAREFQVDNGLRKQLSEKFRTTRTDLLALWEPLADAQSPLRAGMAILQERTARMAPIIATLHQAEQAGLLQCSLAELTASYLHMQVNRLCRSAQRAQEMVLYDFLDRLYTSQLARRQ